MPRHARQLADSGIYHVMLRGVNRDAIFIEEDDYERFLSALDRVRRDSGSRVLAYCLMTNHVHLVLRTTTEPIGTVVKRLGVRYASWFNRKYGRVGHLFQDRFGSRPVEDDAYLVTLLRYVWNNPVEGGLAAEPVAYPWSSLRLLGSPTPLVDESELRRLLPAGALDAISSPAPPTLEDAPARRGRPRRYSDAQVAELLLRACGAEEPEGFARLDGPSQRLAIRLLRTQSVSYAQIAEATGLATSRVRRMHISANEPPPTR